MLVQGEVRRPAAGLGVCVHAGQSTVNASHHAVDPHSAVYISRCRLSELRLVVAAGGGIRVYVTKLGTRIWHLTVSRCGRDGQRSVAIAAAG